METQDGSKYVSLAVKLDELSQVCAQLSRENAELRAQMSRLTARISSERQASQGEPRDGSQDGRFSRRRLGKALAASRPAWWAQPRSWTRPRGRLRQRQQDRGFRD